MRYGSYTKIQEWKKWKARFSEKISAALDGKKLKGGPCFRTVYYEQSTLKAIWRAPSGWVNGRVDRVNGVNTFFPDVPGWRRYANYVPKVESACTAKDNDNLSVMGAIAVAKVVKQLDLQLKGK